MADNGAIEFDFNDLTLGELEEFEDIAGVPASALASGSIPAKAMTALVFLVKRRDDPAYTLADAKKEKISALKWQAAPDPTVSPAGVSAGG